MNNIEVLVTGGAGYKGSHLVEALVSEGCHVTILDNFLYGYESLLGFVANKKISIIKKDIRNIKESDVSSHDIIFHLAAISGYPACEANPHSAQTINVTSTKMLLNYLSNDQILMCASTTSMYGSSGKELDETATPTPVSLYGITSLERETLCMNRPNTIAFRFATIFGTSRRMRRDLLLNDFAYKAVTERSLVLYDYHSKRTFLHVRDAIEAYMMAARNPEQMVDGIFNVGANSMNFSKLEIAEKISKHIKLDIIKSNLEDPDRRDFIINFDKISALGFSPKYSIDDGIEELLRLYSWYRDNSLFRTI